MSERLTIIPDPSLCEVFDGIIGYEADTALIETTVTRLGEPAVLPPGVLPVELKLGGDAFRSEMLKKMPASAASAFCEQTPAGLRRTIILPLFSRIVLPDGTDIPFFAQDTLNTTLTHELKHTADFLNASVMEEQRRYRGALIHNAILKKEEHIEWTMQVQNGVALAGVAAGIGLWRRQKRLAAIGAAFGVSIMARHLRWVHANRYLQGQIPDLVDCVQTEMRLYSPLERRAYQAAEDLGSNIPPMIRFTYKSPEPMNEVN